ncbi:MAG: prepilin-type N-terminal cleavage/methylation domain-containing protein [Chlamydiota bacterium]|nr:prepilin-type N-terminal cleavage/methylation domain-containing protein [Chlamydiota bacterium]
MKTDHKNMQRGLTVLEMLVVVAVIFVIAAMVFPQFKRMRDKGKQIKCMANLKQLCVAVAMYRQDDAFGRFPWWSGWPGTPLSNTCDFWGWDVRNFPEMLWSYLGSETVTASFGSGEMMHFRCPANPETFQTAVRQDINGNLVDFQVNCNLIGRTDAEEVGNASIAYLFIDFPRQGSPNLGASHNSGSNVLFVDGHVEWKSEGALGNAWPGEDEYPGTDVRDWGIKP